MFGFGLATHLGNYIGKTVKTLGRIIDLQKTLTEVAVHYAKHNGLARTAGRLEEQYANAAAAFNEIVDYNNREKN